MAKLKTTPNEQDVEAFINNIENPVRQRDCRVLLQMMKAITGEPPRMWGNSIVGFGTYHYQYDSGREGDWFRTGFSPRKQNLTIYLISGFERFEELMQRLGKYKTGKSCLYVKKLEDVDREVLEELIQGSVDYLSKRYP